MKSLILVKNIALHNVRFTGEVIQFGINIKLESVLLAYIGVICSTRMNYYLNELDRMT